MDDVWLDLSTVTSTEPGGLRRLCPLTPRHVAAQSVLEADQMIVIERPLRPTDVGPRVFHVSGPRLRYVVAAQVDRSDPKEAQEVDEMFDFEQVRVRCWP